MTAAAAYRRLAITLTVLITVTSAVAVLVPAGIGWDFANFYDAGRKILAWQLADLYDPTSMINGQQPQGGMAFWGTPVSALLYAPLGLLQPGAAMAAFKLAGVAATLWSLRILYRLYQPVAGHNPEDPWRLAALVGAGVILFQPFWSVYRVGGQTTPIVLLLGTLALASHMRGQNWLVAWSLVAAVAIKPAFAFLPAALALLSGWRLAIPLAAAGTTVALVSVLTMGWPVHQDFLQVAVRGASGRYHWAYNSSLFVIADNLSLLAVPPWRSSVVGATVLAAKGVVLALFAWLVMYRRRELPAIGRRNLDFLWSLWFCLAISQVVWEHYLVLLFPILVFVAASYRRFSSRALMIAASIVGMSVIQNVTFTVPLQDALDLHAPWPLAIAGLLKSAPLLLTAVLLVLHRGEFVAAAAAGASWSGSRA